MVENEAASAENGIDNEVITSASSCIIFIDDYANMTYKTVMGVFWKTLDFTWGNNSKHSYQIYLALKTMIVLKMSQKNIGNTKQMIRKLYVLLLCPPTSKMQKIITIYPPLGVLELIMSCRASNEYLRFPPF